MTTPVADPNASVESAKETRALLLAALGAAAFAAIGAAAIRDGEFLSGNGGVSLPLLDVRVPVKTYFYVAPFVMLLLAVYVLQDLERLFHAVSRENTSARGVWPLSEGPFRTSGPTFLSIMTQAIVWGTWPALNLYLTARSLPLGAASLSAWNLGLAGVTVAVGVRYWRRTSEGGGKSAVARWAPRGAAAGGVVAALFCVLQPSFLRKLPVAYTDFRSAEVASLDLSARNLRGADFERATVEYAIFCGATLERASFRGARARRANFICDTDPPTAVATVDFGDADLSGVNFSGAVLKTLRGANLTDSTLWRCGLEGADLSGAELSDANLAETRAAGALFRLARGDRVNFFKADLSRARLSRARFNEPNFTSARLDGATLAEAKIVGAKLRGATLRDANLEGADLSDADINGTTVFAGASYNAFTKLPAAIDATAVGLRKVE